jgi:hypothetical protein
MSGGAPSFVPDKKRNFSKKFLFFYRHTGFVPVRAGRFRLTTYVIRIGYGFSGIFFLEKDGFAASERIF